MVEVAVASTTHGSLLAVGLTLRPTRPPPALPSALSSFSVLGSVQRLGAGVAD